MSTTRYGSRATRPVAGALKVTGAVGPSMAVERWLCEHALWGALRRAPARRPDATDRLAVTVDLDYRADTDALPGLLQVVAEREVPLSIAAVGALVEADPAPYEQAVAAGHEIVNHTMSHPDNPVLNPHEEFWHLSTDRMAEEVGRAQDVFEARLGVRPAGFRTPHFKDAHRMLGVLESFPEIDYLSSALDTRSPLGGQPFRPGRVPSVGERWGSHLAAASDGASSRLVQVPLTACPDHRWTPYCSWHGIRADAAPGSGAGMHELADWQRLWGRTLDRAAAEGLAVPYFDPHDLMRDEATVRTFEAMLDEAATRGWRFQRLGEVVEDHRVVLHETPAPR